MIALAWSATANIVIAVGASMTAVGAIWKYMILPPYRFAQRVERGLSFVEKEMKPNGGGSLRDAVDKLVRRTDALETRVEAQERTDLLETSLNAREVPA